MNKEIVRIDFTDWDEYQRFVKDVAQAVTADITFDDELARDIADQIIYYHKDALADALLDKLLRRINHDLPNLP